MKQVGLLPLVNHHMIEFVSLMGCIAGGGLGGTLGLVFVQLSVLHGTVHAWTGAGIGFAVGFAMVIPFAELILSTITAVFVCYAKNGLILQQNRPDLHAEISDAYLLLGGPSLDEAMYAAENAQNSNDDSDERQSNDNTEYSDYGGNAGGDSDDYESYSSGDDAP